jgi:spore maturation protein CgeB
LRLAVVGKAGSITHWLEDAAAAWRADGHEVLPAFTRRPWLALPLETALAGLIAERLRVRLTRFAPELILAIGAYHVPMALLEAIASLPGRPPLVGWVGDVFEESEASRARLYDLVGYTDSALITRHHDWGFAAEPLYLPHAVNPHDFRSAPAFEYRRARMVFIANPTPHRHNVVSEISQPITLYGAGWRRDAGHEVFARRLSPARAPAILAAHQFALNIRNEFNVLSGLNQRNFAPCAAGAALLTDDQPDLETCFEPGTEVLVWRDVGELNDLYDRVLCDRPFAVGVAGRGRARVLAHHTYTHRLASLTAALGSS